MCRSRRTTQLHNWTSDVPARTVDTVAATVPARAGTRWPYGGSNREVRASDQDRAAAIELLNEHTTAGRLTLSEFEERVAVAYAARLVSELDALLTDLPVARARVSQAPGRRPVFASAVWSSWLLTGAICLLIWAVTSIGTGEVRYFWPFWVLVPWGVVLLSRSVAGRARVDRGSRRILDPS